MCVCGCVFVSWVATSNLPAANLDVCVYVTTETTRAFRLRPFDKEFYCRNDVIDKTKKNDEFIYFLLRVCACRWIDWFYQ